jgi:TatD DNase family protein
MIDTHCHLTDDRLAGQLDDVLQRAAAAGVMRMVTIGTDLDDSARCIEICRQHANVLCAVGVHPSSADSCEFSAAKLAGLASEPSVRAVGEIGLDYYWHKEPATQRVQKEIFAAQLRLAEQIGKPAVIHCRQAVADCLAILKGFPRVPAVFHCFTGTLVEAQEILDAGYWLGFTGVVTFKKNQELREVVKMMPADRLLVETDAPYLTPEPMRKQKVNEPAMVVHTARVVAETRGIAYGEIENLTDENALRFFGE